MNKNTLDIARELGKSIKESSEYEVFLQKEENYQNDLEALNIKDELDKKNEIYKEALAGSNQEKINTLNIEIKELNKKLMNKSSYVEYINSKSILKKIVKNINNILEYYTGISEESNCSGCSKGCNK